MVTLAELTNSNDLHTWRVPRFWDSYPYIHHHLQWCVSEVLLIYFDPGPLLIGGYQMSSQFIVILSVNTTMDQQSLVIQGDIAPTVIVKVQ